MKNLPKKINISLLFTTTLLLCISFNSYSQCEWIQTDFEDFEGANPFPFVTTGAIYGGGTHSAGAKNGTKGLWLNVQNGGTGFAGQVLYNRPYNVCPGQDYQFQAWIGGTGGSDFTTSVYDGTNITGIPLATYNSFNGWNFQTIGVFTPTLSTITLVVRNNLQGNGGGNDLKMDDLELQICYPPLLDSLVNLCVIPTQISLYDNLPVQMDNTGSWAGPSALTGGYLGNYDPAMMSPGTYFYTISGAGFCPDTINSVTILAAPNLTTTDITNCDPISADITNSFIDNNNIGGTISYWQDALATISEPNPTNITTTGTYYIVMDTAGCADTAEVNVTITSIPIVMAGPDQTICSGDQVTLIGSGAATLNWTNGVLDGVPFTPTDTTIYILVGINNGCVGSDTVNVFVNPLPSIDAGVAQSVCEGTQVVLNGSGANTYSWDNGVIDGEPFTPISTTIYTLIGTTNNCSDTAQVTVTVGPSPTADIQPSIFTGAPPLIVSFTNGSTLSNSYIWDFGNGDRSSLFSPPNITYQDFGTYIVTLTVTDPITGCQSSKQIEIEVIQNEFTILVPTIFTPNGDGINDVFNPVIENSESYSMTIFNRWGSTVFETNNVNTGWDGKKNDSKVAEGTYYFLIEYSFYKQGVLTSNSVKGTVSLLN